MPTQALAAYGTELRLSDGIPTTALQLTDASFATPIVVATILPHGLPVGDVTWGTVANVAGNTNANGLWVVEATGPNSLKLRGSVGNAAYTGLGTFTPVGTFTLVAELVNITPIGISFNMVDASAHDGNGWGTAIPTLKRGVDARVEINLVPAHPTHDEVTGLLGLALGRIRRDFLIVLPDVGRTTIAFQARVTDHGTVTPIEGVLRSNPVLSIDGKMAWTYS